VIPTGAKAKTFREKVLRNEVLDGRFQRSYLGASGSETGQRPVPKPSESFFKKFSKKAVDGR
jgi:hypothetical protein